MLNNLSKFEYREKIEVHKKMKIKNNSIKSHLTKAQYEIDYKYYICDYCGEEIKLNSNKDERTGGLVYFPKSLTRRSTIQLVLHNKCLKLAIAEVERNNKGTKN